VMAVIFLLAFYGLFFVGGVIGLEVEARRRRARRKELNELKDRNKRQRI
jgi:hypothetical protein